MDLSSARVVLRQRSPLDVLDLALRFLVEHGREYAVVTLAAVLPSGLVSWAIASKAGWVWGWIFAVSLGLVVQGAFTVLASRLVFQPKVKTREVLVSTLRVLPKLLVLRLLQVFVSVVGLFFFVIPGVWMGISLLFLVEVATLERATLGTAVSRSLKLTSGQSSLATAMAFALFVLHAGAVWLADEGGRAVVSSLFQFSAPESMWSAGGSWLALAGFWLFVPFVATARFFAYLDFRTRSEGWDIQTRFAALALRGDEPVRRAA